MALEDKDIFKAIWDRYTDEPVEFIMAQYEKARRMNMEIERRASPVLECNSPVQSEVITSATEIVEEPAPRKKRYTRRNMAVKPEEAIADDYIYCSICGAQRQSLTAKHLATHDLTVAEYKKLCGFPQEMPLMSGRRLAKSKEIIARAQKARLDKRAALADD